MDVKKWLGEENKLGYDIWSRKYKFLFFTQYIVV